MSDVEIIIPTTDDAKEYSIFAAQRFTDTFGYVYDPQDLAEHLEEKYNENAILAEIVDKNVFTRLAKLNGEIIGYVKGAPMSLPIEHEAGAYEMCRLYITNNHKGLGLGKKLYQILLDQAKSLGAPALYLGVWVNNARARAFYTRQGFEIVGQYNYRVGKTLDDERIMRLGLI